MTISLGGTTATSSTARSPGAARQAKALACELSNRRTRPSAPPAASRCSDGTSWKQLTPCDAIVALFEKLNVKTIRVVYRS